MTDLERRVINALQGGFPICERPFDEAARALGIDEAALIDCIDGMLEKGLLTRFGPLYDAGRLGGAFSLCAMEVPAADFDRVAAIVNAMPEVAHNYEREHRLNMWFVVATAKPEGIAGVLARIEAATGLRVLDFPKQDEFRVDLRFVA
jgi:DNA-binding Lrp family transcriptional regulator